MIKIEYDQNKQEMLATITFSRELWEDMKVIMGLDPYEELGNIFREELVSAMNEYAIEEWKKRHEKEN